MEGEHPGLEISLRTAFVPALIAACALFVIVGSVNTWVLIDMDPSGEQPFSPVVSVDGTEGDGHLTLYMGIAAGVLGVLGIARPDLNHGWPLGPALLLFIASTAVGLRAWLDLPYVAKFIPEVGGVTLSGELLGVGWGLMLVTCASAAGAVVSAVALVRESGWRLSLFQRHSPA